MPGRPPCVLKLAPPFNILHVVIQQSGSSHPLSWLKCAYSGVERMLSASFMTSSMHGPILAQCRFFVPAQLNGWSFVCACLAIADLSVRRIRETNLKIAKISFL